MDIKNRKSSLKKSLRGMKHSNEDSNVFKEAVKEALEKASQRKTKSIEAMKTPVEDWASRTVMSLHGKMGTKKSEIVWTRQPDNSFRFDCKKNVGTSVTLHPQTAVASGVVHMDETTSDRKDHNVTPKVSKFVVHFRPSTLTYKIYDLANPTFALSVQFG